MANAQLSLSAIKATGTTVALNCDFTTLNDYNTGNQGRAMKMSGYATVRIALTADTSTLNLRRSDIRRLEFALGAVQLPAGAKAVLGNVHIQYRTQHLNTNLYTGNARNDLNGADTARLYTPMMGIELVDPREEDKKFALNLLHHLNARLESYHKAIWSNMDEDRRYMILDGIKYSSAANDTRSVAGMVENRLLGIVGNCLVLPVSQGTRLTVTNPVDLKSFYTPEELPPPYRISVPTRGVFCEAVMGACNACEKIDDTRYWKWEDHPIPYTPTAINPISMDSRYQAPPNLTPTSFAAPLVGMQNAPEAAAFNGANALIGLLSNPNLFKDLSGLDGNQANALQALITAANSAQGFTQQASNMASKAADLKSQEMAQKHDQKMREIESIKNAPLPPEEKEQQLKDRYDQMNQPPVNVSPTEFKNMVDSYKQAGLSDEDARIITRAKLSKDLDLPNAPDDRKVISNNPEAKAIFASDKGTYSHSSPDGTQEMMSWDDKAIDYDLENDEYKPTRRDYEQNLRNAVGIINIAFGSPTGLRPGYTDGDEFFEGTFWFETARTLYTDGNIRHETGDLVLINGVRPSAAIQSMINNQDLWKLDCSRYVQVIHLVALNLTFGRKNFDKYFAKQNERLTLRTFGTTGVSTDLVCLLDVDSTTGLPVSTYKVYRNGKSVEWEQTWEEVVSTAPIGTRVGFYNRLYDPNNVNHLPLAAYKFENTIKVGNDLYAAQGFADKFTFTSSEIISNLALIFGVTSPVLNDVFISEIEFINSELFL